jgi:hypothetical protein
MSEIIGEDALRRALARMSAEESQDWLRPPSYPVYRPFSTHRGYRTSTPPSRRCSAGRAEPM